MDTATRVAMCGVVLFMLATVYLDRRQNERITDLEDVVLILSKNYLKQAPSK